MRWFPRVGFWHPKSRLVAKKSDPHEDKARIAASGSEDRIDAVTFFVDEAVSVHAVAVMGSAAIWHGWRTGDPCNSSA